MAIISLNQVSKSYGNINAVENLCLSVEEGEIYGFIGPNGAGKSTTIRLLLNFLQCDKGDIRVLGYNPQTDDVKIKHLTGYVSAETFIYSDMHVSDIFKFTASYYRINPAERLKQLNDILEIDVHKKFGQLSFGNRKKVAIACAMLHSPKLLILDEPSNGLDPLIRTNLYDLLKEEQKNGVTIFFSSHVLHEVQKFCTRIGLIKEGVLIRESSASEFTKVGYRQVRIETNDDLDLTQLQGVADFNKQDNNYRFMYSGNPDELIRILNSIRIKSIFIEEPELENIFLHYFK